MGAQNSFKATAPANSAGQTATTANSQGLVDKSNYGTAIDNAQNGIGTLASALQQQAAGNGPAQGLVQGQLNNATNNAIQSSAGVVAGTKGINPAMAAKLAGQQAANQTQNAANQSSINQANIATNSQNALGSLLGNQLSTSTNAQNTQNANNINDVQQTQSTNAGNFRNSQDINAGVSQKNTDSSNSLFGGVGNAIAGIGAALLAKGGSVPTNKSLGRALVGHYDQGGSIIPVPSVNGRISEIAPDSTNGGAYKSGAVLGTTLKKLFAPKSLSSSDYQAAGMTNPNLPATGLDPETLKAAGMKDIGGQGAGAQALVQPEVGNQYASADPTLGASLGQPLAAPVSTTPSLGLGSLIREARGGSIDFRAGGHVPGKAAVPGNSLKNDTVPAMLSPKEIVLPRSVTLADDAPERAKAFVQAIQKKSKESERNSAVPAKEGYAKILSKHREVKARMAELDSMLKGGK